MLKTNTLLFFALFSLSICAQSTSSTQKTLITKRTATWCPNCGSWGWDMAKGIEALDNSNAILMRAHHSGNLQSQAAKDITENFNALYQPEFYINEERQEVGSTTWSGQIDVFKEIIEDNAFGGANVAIKISSTFEDKELTAEVEIEALRNLEGEYYLGVYVLEDSILDVQSGLGNEVLHNSVLRRAFTESTFGERIFESDLTSGATAEFSSTIELESAEPAERYLKTLVIVWKKDGDRYLVENVHQVNTSQFSSLKDSVDNALEFNVFQSGSSIIIENSTDIILEDGRADLLSIDGKLITGMLLDPMNRNEISIDVNKWSGQIVLVRIIGQDQVVKSAKLFIK